MSIDHTQTIIQLDHISFGYTQDDVIDDITLPIHRGDYLAIVGPNGGGKSTLLKLMLGLLPPRAGTISLFDTPIKSFKDWKKVGYVSQQATRMDENFPMTVEEAVMMGRYPRFGFLHWPSYADREAVEKALVSVDMQEYKKRRIGELSGGQKQRVFIARCLAGEPEVIVLDEPTGGVDVKTQVQFYTLLRKLNTELHLTLILVSHEIDILDNEASEIAYVNRQLIYHGDPKKFVHTDYFATLTGKEIAPHA